ncbi:ArpU family phage packaging/lysis transcriptional regulator [Sporosarcina saromensis]|uniref:ArpU family phage packaging/lysis transcriptional regulator n=1 Tax=Sporosarcina saromensis TaxID=359365 RepID=A0ABU4G5H0_9BACL|nr:ArpU family phage packaging/lysis transcriptional regulator [Sporosarcina saromensis]MDW0112220.1 ArpU family phage packaging/lysis transcriptional regulator [Sporosarcina saromensis]
MHAFCLQEIDREATKQAVDEVLEKYRMYSLQVSLDKLPSVTAKYSLAPISGRGIVHSAVESAAINNVDFEIKREKFLNWVVYAVNRLNFQERSILITRYLNNDDLFDYEVYTKLNMSERQYYRIKSRLFYKLAFALKIEVYKGEGIQ